MKLSKRTKKLIIVFVLSGALSVFRFFYPSFDVDINQGALTKESLDFSQKTLVHVLRVIDGDTIKVLVPDYESEVTVRFIGINTPESVDPRRPVECFGIEASSMLASLIADKDVYIEYDSTQSKVDKYGRSLGYVYDLDGVLINKKMIEDGYAFEYTYHVPYLYQKEFKEAERVAKMSGRGLWDKQVCGY